MTAKKQSSSGWWPVYGDTLMETGVHKWTIHVDNYSTSDWSGFTIGV